LRPHYVRLQQKSFLIIKTAPGVDLVGADSD
jgi:hypothetical protein